MDGGVWWAAVHGVAESWTQLSDFTFTFLFHAMEKEMATHSSVLAWRIKWQPTPVLLPGKSHGQRSLAGYSPWGHKRVRHDLVIKQKNF